MGERHSYTWEELNRGYKTKIRAGHVYAVERATAPGSGDHAGLKHWLLLSAVVGVPVALVIIPVMAAALGH